MRGIRGIFPALAGIVCIACTACDRAPGYPRAGAEVARPDQVLDFHMLYSENCSGCHGANGRGGAALPLNDPAYLAIAGADNLRRATANGIDKTLMPAFAQSAGGMLTDQQIDSLVQGMLHEWSRPAEFASLNLPSYSANTTADLAAGQKAFVTACARCHGNDGAGLPRPPDSQLKSIQDPDATPFSVVDPNYLSLISDQGLRSLIMTGHPDSHAADWRTCIPGSKNPLSAQQITDIVAWIVSHRPKDFQREAGNAQPARNSGKPSNAGEEQK